MQRAVTRIWAVTDQQRWPTARGRWVENGTLKMIFFPPTKQGRRRRPLTAAALHDCHCFGYNKYPAALVSRRALSCSPPRAESSRQPINLRTKRPTARQLPLLFSVLVVYFLPDPVVPTIESRRCYLARNKSVVWQMFHYCRKPHSESGHGRYGRSG